MISFASRSAFPSLPALIRPLGATLALVFGLCCAGPLALAGPVSSLEIVTDSTRPSDLATVQLALEHKVVQQRLSELGFTPDEIEMRLAQASDVELHQLAVQSETLMAGGDGGVIVSILVIVILVLLILRIT